MGNYIRLIHGDPQMAAERLPETQTTLLIHLRGDEEDAVAAAKRTLELVSSGGSVLDGSLLPAPTDGSPEPTEMGTDLVNLAERAAISDRVEAMPGVLAVWPERISTLASMARTAFNNGDGRL